MKKHLLLLALLFLFTCPLYSAHIVGGEITYDCLGPAGNGNMNYRFTIIIYRDCFGTGAAFDGSGGRNSTQMHVTFYQGDDDDPFEIRVLNPPETEPVPISLANNPCIIIPREACVEEGVYTFEQELPISNESYYLIYQRCCRNNTIDNIRNPGSSGSTYSVEITPEAQSVCNDSPTFNDFPPIVICANEPLIFDHSASDNEGDQLVYSFCSPLLGGSAGGGGGGGVAPNPDRPPADWEPVSFSPPFTGANPLGGNPRVVIDPNTGLITGTPDQQGQYVVGICVQEFRNGVLLSELRRDFQFNITRCEPQVNAVISGSTSGNVYSYRTCNDPVINMINRSTDVSFIEAYEWRFDINGSPLVYNTRDITATFPGPGKYTGTMILNPGADADCSDTAIIDVVIAPPMDAQFDFDYDTCIAGPVNFFDQTIEQGGNPIDQWVWSFGDGGTSNDVDPEYQYLTPGLRDVTLRVIDTLGCEAEATQQVTWFPVPPLIVVEPSSEVGCPPLPVSFTNLSTPINTAYDVQWDFGDGNFGTGLSPSHVYNEAGFKTVTVEITSPIGCYTSKVFEDLIEVDSSPVAAFTFTPQTGLSNFNPRVQFVDQSRHIVEWEWDFGGQGSSGIPSPEFVFPDTGLQVVQLIGTHFYGCKDTTEVIVDIVPEITYFLPNAFTPNSDGKNEFFRGGGFFRGIRNFNMKIFNRWGQTVFETKAPDEGWNGLVNNNGKPAQNGIYVYVIQFTGPRGQFHEYNGFATLIR